MSKQTNQKKEILREQKAQLEKKIILLREEIGKIDKKISQIEYFEDLEEKRSSSSSSESKSYPTKELNPIERLRLEAER